MKFLAFIKIFLVFPIEILSSDNEVISGAGASPGSVWVNPFVNTAICPSAFRSLTSTLPITFVASFAAVSLLSAPILPDLSTIKKTSFDFTKVESFSAPFTVSVTSVVSPFTRLFLLTVFLIFIKSLLIAVAASVEFGIAMPIIRIAIKNICKLLKNFI
ncbi:hypothetical protein H4683_003566 [Filibacter limicola]|uniref:Uncharacterized protein n=1 Tax=Sporosarcina limicola TaxID=34101 RepID=A0A927R4P6_9BACL|nr:hypothetical protein [Sporosarcina limicola]